MDKDIVLIMNLTGCNEETANASYEEKNKDVLLAIDSILFGNTPVTIKKRKREDITEDEEYLNAMRPRMEQADQDINNHRSTTTNPLEPVESDETPDHLEETALQSNCLQECQIPSMEEAVQTQGTVCLPHLVHSCDSL
jgi:hypothetical protein